MNESKPNGLLSESPPIRLVGTVVLPSTQGYPSPSELVPATVRLPYELSRE